MKRLFAILCIFTMFMVPGYMNDAAASSHDTSMQTGLSATPATGDDGPCKICGGSGKCESIKYNFGDTKKAYCKGSGKCSFCDGKGWEYDFGSTNTHTCGVCHGDKKCRTCGGTGKCKHCGGKPYDRHASSGKSSVSKAAGSSSTYGGTSAASDEDYESTLGKLAGMDPMAAVIVVGAAAVLSYGLFGYSAIRNWNTSSSLYPALELRTGFSFMYGEGISARAMFGGKGGVVVSAGYGLFLSDIKYSRSVHAGAGFYVSPGHANNISWTWEIGKGTADMRDIVYSTQAEYTHYFGRNLQHGVFGGIGVGCGGWSTPYIHTEWMPEFRLGYTWRFHDMHYANFYTNDSGLFFSFGLGYPYSMADLTAGYKMDEHWSFGLNLSVRSSNTQVNAGHGAEGVHVNIVTSARASYRLNDKKWSPLASISTGIGPCKEYGSYKSGTFLHMTPEIGMSQRFNNNNYMEYTIGLQVGIVAGYSDYSVSQSPLSFGVNVRYVRVLDVLDR